MPERAYFWGIEGVALFYSLAGLALLAFGWGVWRRARHWRRHDAARVAVSPRRLVRALRHGLSGVVRLRGDRRAALLHGLIATGFCLLFGGTLLATLDHYVVHFLVGDVYLVYSVVLDVAGVAFLVGLLGAAVRRYVVRVPRLDSRRQDAAVLVGLAVVAASGFAVEAVRLAATQPEHAGWSFGGAALGRLLVDPQAEAVYPATWWFHAVASLALIAALPYTRLVHLLAAPAHLAVADEAAARLPVDERPEDAPALALRDALALHACTRCGRCVAVCPAAAAGEPFSPRGVLDAARHGLGGEASPLGLLGSGTLAWHCTTCGACLEACPISIATADVARAARRVDVEDGTRVPAPLTDALDRLQRYGNPWEASKKGRSAFAKELALPTLSDEPGALAWQVGCTTSIDTRAQGLARAFARLLTVAETPVATLGRKEGCCGDVARQLGEEGLFEEQNDKLLAALEKARATDVVASSPHCLTSLEADGRRVRHTSEVLDELVASGALALDRPVPARATFHDPCYLGRHRGVFAAPRRLLGAIPGLQVVEMEHSGADSRCCGGGGGRMWQEELDGETMMSELRVRQAAATGASLLVTACPLCLVMLDDARKAAGLEESLEVVDLCELAARAVFGDDEELE